MNNNFRQELGISTHQELLLTVENLKKEIKMYEELTKVLKIQLTHERGKDNDIKDRRRRIFEQIALSEISQNEKYWAVQAERVIKAADEFAEKEIE